MERIAKQMLGALVAGLVLTGRVMGSPVVGSSEYFDGGNMVNWFLDNRGGANISYNNPSDYLELTFANGGAPREAVMYTTDPNFIGQYFGQPADFSVQFSLSSLDATPSAAGLYFRGANGTEWVYYVTPPTAGNTAGYALSTVLQDYNQWQNLTGLDTLASWQTAFSAVDRFGIYVLENPLYFGNERYGFDALSLTVPEPETVWLIVAALASLGVTFRGRLNETVRGLIKRI